MSTVIGVFNQTEAAEKAVKALREKGFTENEISIIAKEQGKAKKSDMEVGGEFGTNENIADGTAWGGALGGLAGILAGVGALAIPGIGPIVAAGP
ncbi:MAG TPA: general stress protein, partial [Limnochordia bacterium]|nr:general stress protein [Limnochordia bacterium]